MAIGTSIPLDIIKRIIPAIMKQAEQISKFATDLSNKAAMIPENTKCEDPITAELKDQLQQIQQAIETLKQLLNLINTIIPILQNIGTIGIVIKIVQLLIPSVPGVPNGPITEIINTITQLITNIKSAIKALEGVQNAVNRHSGASNSNLAKSVNKIGGICVNDVFDISQELADELNRLNGLDSGLDSEFYKVVNVSDEDILDREQLIQELLQQQTNLLAVLKEAPSQVINQSGIPNNSIGDVGDYYIDSSTNSVYGPKTNIGWKISTINL
jgi:DNA repair exonuclease SbcCD ATPase subunit